MKYHTSQTARPQFLSFYCDVVHSKNVYVSMCGSLCRYSYTNSALSRRVLLSTLNNNGDCFMESSILSMKRKLREVYECSNECTAVGTCVKDLCLMKDGYYQRLYMGKMGQLASSYDVS